VMLTNEKMLAFRVTLELKPVKSSLRSSIFWPKKYSLILQSLFLS